MPANKEQVYISTGRDTLDKMICNDPLMSEMHSSDASKRRGIPAGSVVLIRGEPGSGKTTLAMQILSTFLCDPKSEPAVQESDLNKQALFLSYEEMPDKLLPPDGRLTNYGMFDGLKLVLEQA